MRKIRSARRDLGALERRRFEALRLMGNGMKMSEVARRMKVTRQTVSRWANRYADGGISALKKAQHAGRKSRLTEQDQGRLSQMLKQGPEVFGYAPGLWSCPKVADLIKSKFNISYHPGHVWKILDKLGVSMQLSSTRLMFGSGGIIGDNEKNKNSTKANKKLTI